MIGGGGHRLDQAQRIDHHRQIAGQHRPEGRAADQAMARQCSTKCSLAERLAVPTGSTTRSNSGSRW